MAGIAAAITYFFPTPRTTTDDGAVRRAAEHIAVLPLENFSDDKENAFFADGIQDES